jgi:hypothetical protein
MGGFKFLLSCLFTLLQCADNEKALQDHPEASVLEVNYSIMQCRRRSLYVYS